MFAVDVVTELTRDGVLCEILFASALVLMSKAIEGLREVYEMDGGF